MPQWLQWALIIIGLLAVAFLAWFIIRQLKLMKASRQSQQKTEALQQERRRKMVESLRVLAMAVEADQMEYSEACLRIKGLLDHVAPELLGQSPFTVFQEVHDQIQHMPTHNARQKTDTRFVEKMDQERLAVEKQHAEAIQKAATALRSYDFSI